jgi:hypothetical protein
MNALLVIGTVIVILAIAGALFAYLYLIGSVVEHIAETLSEKVAPGAQEVGQHAAALPAAASSLRRQLGILGRISASQVPAAGR